MNHERITEDVRELAALYALGSLTQNEARSFELHIQDGCSACEAELRRFERIVSGIGFSADEAEVPEKIRELLLDYLPDFPHAMHYQLFEGDPWHLALSKRPLLGR